MRIPWRLLAGTTLVLLLPGGVSTATTAVPADDPPVPAEFTARSMGGIVVDPGTLEFRDDFIAYRGLTETGTIPESSDARFSGTWSWTGNRDQYSDPVDFWLWNGSFRVENEDGAWQGVPTVWLDGRTADTQPVTTMLVGEGSYEGWIVVTEVSDAGTQWAFDGVIFEGDIPPAP